MVIHYWLLDQIRGCSSAGRAPALQAGGRQFDSVHLHQSTIEVRNLYLCKSTSTNFRSLKKDWKKEQLEN